MEFKIYEYNDTGISLAMYIDTYISAIWTERYFDCGEFELQLTATNEIVNLIHRDMLVERADVDSQMICIIEKIELSDDNENGETITLKGRCASAITARRVMIIQFDNNMVMYGMKWANAQIKTILHDIITRFCTNPTEGYHETPYYHLRDLKNRKIPHFFCDDSDMITQCDARIGMQEKGAVVLDKITELCAGNGIGIRTVLIDGNIHLQFYDGIDRSVTQGNNSPVIFSKDFDNISSQKLAVNQTDNVNVVYIGGCGEGEKRVFEFTELVAVQHPEEIPPKVGLNRFEKYADRRDMGAMNDDGKPEIDGDTTDYRTALLAEAELSLRDIEIVSESKILSTSQFAYRNDFLVGDFVTINGKYATEKSRIIEVIETDDASNGYVISISTAQNDVAQNNSSGNNSGGGVIGGSDGNSSRTVKPATYTEAGVVIVDNETMTVDSTGKITVKEINHPDIETSNPTVPPSSVDLSFGDRFSVITGIDRDSNGHVKDYDIKLYQLPTAPEVTVKNVVAPAPNVPINIVSSGDVFLNHVVDGAVVSSHLVTGGGGTKVKSHSSGSGTIDGVIEITSSCANTGTFTHDTANMTIDTGFTDTPKLFKLHYYDSSENAVKLAVECRPELDAPFNLINHSGLPINSVEFEGGTATIDAATSTGLSMMWETYI